MYILIYMYSVYLRVFVYSTWLYAVYDSVYISCAIARWCASVYSQLMRLCMQVFVSVSEVPGIVPAFVCRSVCSRLISILYESCVYRQSHTHIGLSYYWRIRNKCIHEMLYSTLSNAGWVACCCLIDCVKVCVCVCIPRLWPLTGTLGQACGLPTMTGISTSGHRG